jgi:tRNA A37 methylthiotransferase MiaB
MVAVGFPKMRIRFSTSNPQDMHESVLHVIAKYPIFVSTFTCRFNLEATEFEGNESFAFA